jgi:TonB family protein
MKNRLEKLLWTAAILASAFVFAADDSRKLKIQITPDYPEIASRMNLHGTVKLKLTVAPNGEVKRVEYVGGHPLLADSAVKAVKVWRYEPAASESTVQVDLKF